MKSIENNFDNPRVNTLLHYHFYQLRSNSPEGSTHVLDIEGLKVYTTKNHYLGFVDFIFHNGANDVLAIKQNNQYIYVPFITSHTQVIPKDKILINHETI